MTDPLVATLEPLPGRGRADDLVVVLRIVNVSASVVEVLNPDLGRPSSRSSWPWSDEEYRVSLLLSYGYLDVAVVDLAGARVQPEIAQTWATPVLQPPTVLAPGDSCCLTIPLGRFFPLRHGVRYRVFVEYGGAVKVHAEGTVDVAGSAPAGTAG